MHEYSQHFRKPGSRPCHTPLQDYPQTFQVGRKGCRRDISSNGWHSLFLPVQGLNSGNPSPRWLWRRKLQQRAIGKQGLDSLSPIVHTAWQCADRAARRRGISAQHGMRCPQIIVIISHLRAYNQHLDLLQRSAASLRLRSPAASAILLISADGIKSDRPGAMIRICRQSTD